VPVTRRSRTIGSSPERVWSVVGDPHHLPRWWPRVARVEGASSERWTQVLMTAKGKPVRADFRLVRAEEPRCCAWEQELEGTPFGRLMAEARTDVMLEPRGEDATEVSISVTQRLRSWSRLTPFLFRRAARTQLDEALAGLDRICA
jgi:uncharacterized protein YndB with AHSA1/START domain